MNADKTKYMVMSRYQNAGRTDNIKTDNSSFERVEEFRYMATTVTNQISVREEIKNRFKSGCASCHSMQNLLSPNSVPKSIKIKIYRTTIFLFCMGVKFVHPH